MMRQKSKLYSQVKTRMEQIAGTRPTVGFKLLFAILALVVLSRIYGCEERRIDQEFEIHCKKDGGTRIYEKVIVPAGTFAQWHQYMISTGSLVNRYGPNYRTIETREVLIGGDVEGGGSYGQLVRLSSIITRRSDEKNLAEQIGYLREGGLPIMDIGIPSRGRGCPKSQISFTDGVFSEMN